MPLLAATDAGVFRLQDGAPDTRTRVVDMPVTALESGPDETLFVGGPSGLYRSRDGGMDWEHVHPADGTDLPADVTVHAVTTRPDGTALYVGTSPPHVVRADPDGTGWEHSDGFAQFPGRDDWRWGGDPEAGTAGVRVRSYATAPAQPDRVYAAVESVGVFRSDDGGRQWTKTSRGLQADPHHVRALDAETVVAACGDGIYRTDDAGRTWGRLDTARELFWLSYCHATIEHDGVFYACLEDRSEKRADTVDGARTVVLRSTDGGRSFERERVPGETRRFGVEGTVDRFIYTWAVDDGILYGLTRGGELLDRENGTWSVRGSLPGDGRALLAI